MAEIEAKGDQFRTPLLRQHGGIGSEILAVSASWTSCSTTSSPNRHVSLLDLPVEEYYLIVV
jgi:hypothetical protein